jgi:5-methylcytosine-specific restriction enzyme A
MAGQWKGSTRRTRLPSNWPAIRAYVLTRDGHQCQLRYAGCTSVATEADHITAGDDHRTVNLQAACSPCHATKSAREGGTAWAAKRSGGRLEAEQHPGLR